MSFSGATPSEAVATAADVLGPWFRTLARSVQTGVVLLDAEGTPVFSNQVAGELLGLPALEGTEPAFELLVEAIPASIRQPSPGKGAELEVEVDAPCGRRQILLRAVPLDGEDCGSLLLVEDRTRMAALEASLVLASRAQTGSLLRSQLHDLKAPLNALALNLELLRKSLKEEEGKEHDAREQQTAATDLLEREIKRLGRSLDRLLRHATQPVRGRIEERRIEIRRPVRETARLVRQAAKSSGVRLRTELPKESTYAIADRDRLKQALLNVVLNALEAQSDGGEVRIRVQSERAHVRLSIEDDGPGVPEHLLGKVFEMNFTTKEEGTGIGLTVARSLVEAQGGRLNLTSTAGNGTTVEILLSKSCN